MVCEKRGETPSADTKMTYVQYLDGTFYRQIGYFPLRNMRRPAQPGGFRRVLRPQGLVHQM